MADGGFSGKYSHEIPTQQLNQSAEGKFEWVVSVGDLLSKSGDSAIGSMVHDWWCVTESNAAKIEIVRVEILEN